LTVQIQQVEMMLEVARGGILMGSFLVFNRFLLEKEWYHNRGYYLVCVILFIFNPVISILIQWLGGSMSEWADHLYYILHFGAVELGHPDFHSGTPGSLWVVISILLGSLLLGEERKGSLNYLVSTPVSRNEIIVAKFLAGAGVIIFAMGLNSLFLVGMGVIHPMPYTHQDVLNWALLITSACLAFFTLALMVSTFTAGVLSAGMICYFLSYLPRTFISMADTAAYRYFDISESLSIKLHYWGSYLSIGDYITRSGRQHVTSIDHLENSIMTGIAANGIMPPDYMLESLLLLLAVIIFLFLAVKIFERADLESFGSVFALSTARRACLAIIIVFIYYFIIFPRAETLIRFILYMILLCVATYKAINLICRRCFAN
jgi:ABC-type transport system involved in multi-copper enzyme maturation permease subunit